MYESKMVCCLKANGKVLREHKDTVYVPFGTEYSILIKNLNSVRALVRISIDGKDITDGATDFVINPNSETEFTRFLPNGNRDKGNRFKFIERTAGVEQHRGIGVEDGIVRVEFQFEKPLSTYVGTPDYWRDKVYYRDPNYFGTLLNQSVVGTAATRSVFGGATNDGFSANAAYLSNSSYAAKGPDVTMCSTSFNATPNDAGITVPGSVSNQKFQQVQGFLVEDNKHVMVLRLFGETTTGKRVVEPVTVKTKPKCITCGKLNKATSKFCSDCGTSLELV